MNWVKNRSWKKVATIVALTLGLYKGVHWFDPNHMFHSVNLDSVLFGVSVGVAALIDARKGRKFRKELPKGEA